MFEEIITSNEVKFNDLEKKVFKFVCHFGCLILKLLIESYDRKLMKARDKSKYRHKGLRKNTIKTIMGEIEYQFTLMLEDRKIQVWSYNIETIIAEKFESIIKRGVFSTRIRDYYDVYMLVRTQSKNIDNKTLKDAIIYTANHRESGEILKEWKEVVEILKDNKKMQEQWTRYQQDNFYTSKW